MKPPINLPQCTENTQSKVKLFLECKQKFAYRHWMHLTSKRVSLPLLIGSGVHAGLEILLAKGGTTLVKRSILAELAVHAVFDKKLEKASLTDGLDTEKLQYARTQACAVIAAWAIVHGDEHKDWTFIGSEINVRASGTTTFEERMAGKIDGVVIDPNGDIWIMEHKTRGSITRFDFVSGLDLDMQALWYMILSKRVMEFYRPQLLKHFKEPKNSKRVFQVRGFFYDAMAKPLHRTGATFEALKARMVDAMVQDPDKYFLLQPVLVEKATVEAAYANFERIVAEMDRTTPQTITRNFSSCTTYGSGGCEYQPLCKNSSVTDSAELIMSLPYAGQYDIVPPNQELDDDGEED